MPATTKFPPRYEARRDELHGEWIIVDSPDLGNIIARCRQQSHAERIAEGMNLAEALGSAELQPPSIAPGDVVRLRSGGPLMTVGQVQQQLDVLGGGKPTVMVASCFWIRDDAGGGKSALLPVATLDRVDVKVMDLFRAALALWGDAEVVNGHDGDDAFDYMVSRQAAANVRALAAALTALDGKPRAYEPDKED